MKIDGVGGGAMHVLKVSHYACLLSKVIFQKYFLSFMTKIGLKIANNIFSKIEDRNKLSSMSIVNPDFMRENCYCYFTI